MSEELAGGYYSAPVRRGDQAGTETLSFIAGQAGTYPLTAPQRSDQALVNVARAIRAMHDATAGFSRPLPTDKACLAGPCGRYSWCAAREALRRALSATLERGLHQGRLRRRRSVKAHPAGRRHVRAGIVSGLWRYPVKSMAGEALASTDISWAGLAGDRRWAFVRPDSQGNGFPWHTIREFPEMSNYVARLDEPARPDKSRILVQTPDGGRYDVTDPRLAAELGTGLRVMRLDRGLFDAMPVSVISDSTVSALCTLADVPGNELRFRPNVVVTLDSGAAFEEDEWVGSAVRIGAAVVRLDRRDSRCVIVNVDPARGLPDSHLLKVIGTTRGACAGVYGTTVRPGLIRVGDPVVTYCD